MSDAPVLVAVDGGIATLTLNRPAAGAGISLALIGDIVIAGEAANFTAAYGRIGLSPDGGLSWLLPRVIGMRKAQDIIIANRRVDAAEAEAIGMVTRVVGSDELAAEGAKHAARLLWARPVQSVRRALYCSKAMPGRSKVISSWRRATFQQWVAPQIFVKAPPLFLSAANQI